MTQPTDLKRSVIELRDKWAGRDVWVVCSGPSMDRFPAWFFNDKLTIGVNKVWQRFRCDYVVAKERESYQEGGHLYVVTKHCSGNKSWPEFEVVNPTRPYYVADHNNNQPGRVVLSPIGSEDALVASDSTATTAFHLAAYMGAATVYVCGHDCGGVAGRMNYEGYYPPDHPNRDWYEGWLGKLADQSRQVQQALTTHYKTHFFTVSPYVGLRGADHV